MLSFVDVNPLRKRYSLFCSLVFSFPFLHFLLSKHERKALLICQMRENMYTE
jgi:hypothetical protein